MDDSIIDIRELKPGDKIRYDLGIGSRRGRIHAVGRGYVEVVSEEPGCGDHPFKLTVQELATQGRIFRRE